MAFAGVPPGSGLLGCTRAPKGEAGRGVGVSARTVPGSILGWSGFDVVHDQHLDRHFPRY